jgi:PIN domain nuclease of toxin-antitoxin system
MTSYVIDAHALFWYLSKSEKLSPVAEAAIASAEAGNGTIFVPAIALAELYYLNRKLSKPLDFKAKYHELQASDHFELMPIEPEDVLNLDATRFIAITEMHDRLIAIAAHRLGVGLITKDANITASNAVPIIW